MFSIHYFCHWSNFVDLTRVIVGPSALCAPEQLEQRNTPKLREAPDLWIITYMWGRSYYNQHILYLRDYLREYLWKFFIAEEKCTWLLVNDGRWIFKLCFKCSNFIFIFCEVINYFYYFLIFLNCMIIFLLTNLLNSLRNKIYVFILFIIILKKIRLNEFVIYLFRHWLQILLKKHICF